MADIRIKWAVLIGGLTQTAASVAAHGALGAEYWGPFGDLDVSPDLMGLSMRRGRNGPLNAVSAGTVTIQLNDPDRKYVAGTQWFENTSLPVGYQDSIIGSLVQVTARPRNLGATITMFTGYIDSLNTVSDGQNTNIIEIRVVDTISRLSTISLKEGVMEDASGNTPPTFPAQQSGDRIKAILQCKNIASGKVVLDSTHWNIDLGDSAVQAMEVTGNVWRELQRLAETEWSPGLFIDPSGRLRFTRRTGYTPSTMAVLVDTVSDSGSDIQYRQLKLLTDKRYVWNQITLEREDPDGVLGGVAETAESTDSQQVYGIREFSRRGLLNLTNSAGTLQTQALAAYWRDQWYRHTAKPTEVKVALNALSYANQRLVLALDIASVVQVKWNPQGTGTVDELCAVDQIAFSLRPGGQDLITFKLSPSWAFPSDTGRIGTGTIGTATLGI